MNKPYQPCMRGKRHQSGLSLVEIMVAVTISLILLAGVIQIFLSSRSSYSLQEGMGRMQENARFVTELFSNEISMAGYSQTVPGIPSAPIQGLNNTGQSIDGGGNNPDQLEVTYTSPTDCLGNATAGIATNVYSIGVDPGNNSPSLMCQGQPLINGVENMQILYGIDTNADRTADQYVSSANVPNWMQVVAVRVALLLTSVESVRSGTDNNVYALLNAPTIGPIGDTLKRRVYTSTILVRNPAP